MFIDFRERKEEREKHQLIASPMHPNQGSNPQPRYVPRSGIKPTAFWCPDDTPSNGATQPAQVW